MLAALSTLLGPAASAHQDDIPLRFDRPARLFDSGSGVRALAGAAATLDVAPYLLGGDHHRWHGRAAGELAMLSFGPDVVWRMGLSVQTVADYGNSINFRLVRLFYEVPFALDWRVGPGVASLVFRHRCSHGADEAIEDRILIRSNLELGYAASWRLGPVELGGEATFGLTLIGQNTDRRYQPRMLATAVATVAWRLLERFSLIAGAGIGLAVHGVDDRPPPPDDEGVYFVDDPWGALGTRWLPVGTIGVSWRGDAATLRLMLHFQRLMDTGLTRGASDAWLLAPRIVFVF